MYSSARVISLNIVVNSSCNFLALTLQGVGFALNVKYDVHVKFDKLANEKLYGKFDPEYSVFIN